MLRIIVSLPRNRWNAGRLRLYNDSRYLLLDVPARGKADNEAAAKAGNPRRDPTLPYGDTPAGTYAPVSAVAARPESVQRIGAWWLPMEGVDGDALKAKLNGRTGLGIHAGRGDGELIATHGCVRLRDADFSALIGLMAGRPASLSIIDDDTAAAA